MKVVVNKCYGGFCLSHKAVMRYAELKGIKLFVEEDHIFPHYYLVEPSKYKECSKKWFEEDGNNKRINEKNWYFSANRLERTDKILIQVIEELGKEASTNLSSLVIVEIPDGIEYEIDDYDGIESIHEVHRSW